MKRLVKASSALVITSAYAAPVFANCRYTGEQCGDGGPIGAIIIFGMILMAVIGGVRALLWGSQKEKSEVSSIILSIVLAAALMVALFNFFGFVGGVVGLISFFPISYWLEEREKKKFPDED